MHLTRFSGQGTACPGNRITHTPHWTEAGTAKAEQGVVTFPEEPWDSPLTPPTAGCESAQTRSAWHASQCLHNDSEPSHLPSLSIAAWEEVLIHVFSQKDAFSL